MFIRENKNRSGDISIRIVSRHNGICKVVKTVGFGATRQEIEELKSQAKTQLAQLTGTQNSLFMSAKDDFVEQAMQTLSNSSIRTVGSELVFGKIYDYISVKNKTIIVFVENRQRVGWKIYQSNVDTN